MPVEMKMSFRSTYSLCALVLSLALLATAEHANAVDSSKSHRGRPVKVLIPWTDGFPADSARLFADELSKRLKQPVLVEVRATSSSLATRRTGIRPWAVWA